MSVHKPENLSELSMEQLFRMEVDTQSAVLTSGLLAVEQDPASAENLQSLMRAAHSLKGAARIVGRQSAARIAHAMEDCVVAAQKGALSLNAAHVDVLLGGVDLLGRISRIPDAEFQSWQQEHNEDIEAFLLLLAKKSDNEYRAASGCSNALICSIDRRFERFGQTHPCESIYGNSERARPSIGHEQFGTSAASHCRQSEPVAWSCR